MALSPGMSPDPRVFRPPPSCRVVATGIEEAGVRHQPGATRRQRGLAQVFSCASATDTGEFWIGIGARVYFKLSMMNK